MEQEGGIVQLFRPRPTWRTRRETWERFWDFCAEVYAKSGMRPYTMLEYQFIELWQGPLAQLDDPSGLSERGQVRHHPQNLPYPMVTTNGSLNDLLGSAHECPMISLTHPLA